MQSRESIGLTKGMVEVVGHHAEWSAAAGRLAARLATALGDVAVAIEHVGSTAVPGLPAKPILDIAVRLAPHASDVVHRLTAAGYEFRGDKGADGGMLFVAESRPLVRTAHIHVVAYADPQFARYLTVRDRLRRDPDAAARYAALKRELAALHPADRQAYTRGKNDFLRDLLGGI